MARERGWYLWPRLDLDRRFLGYAALTLAVLAVLALKIAPPGQEAVEGCRVSYVYDGDTVELTCGTETKTARLQGFDTAETRDAKCREERAHGQKARERLKEMIEGAQTDLVALGHDKYGRLLVRLKVGGTDVGEALIREGLAARYEGGKRQNWCRVLKGA